MIRKYGTARSAEVERWEKPQKMNVYTWKNEKRICQSSLEGESPHVMEGRSNTFQYLSTSALNSLWDDIRRAPDLTSFKIQVKQLIFLKLSSLTFTYCRGHINLWTPFSTFTVWKFAKGFKDKEQEVSGKRSLQQEEWWDNNHDYWIPYRNFRKFLQVRPRSHNVGEIWKNDNHHLDLCLMKTRWGKSRDYRDVIVFKMFYVHTKTQSRRLRIASSVFETD